MGDEANAEPRSEHTSLPVDLESTVNRTDNILLVAFDFGGSFLKVIVCDRRNPYRDEFVMTFPGRMHSFHDSHYAPSRLSFRNGKVAVGFQASSDGSAYIADVKRLYVCDRNEVSDLQVQRTLAGHLGIHEDDLEISHWYEPFVRYMISALQDANYFKDRPAVRLIFTIMCNTPEIYRNFMKEIAHSCFSEESLSLTGEIKIMTISEPQAALRFLSHNLGTKNKLTKGQITVVVDVGGTSVDFVAGVFNDELGVLQSRYCPLSLVYAGVDLERRGLAIMLEHNPKVEAFVKERIPAWMAQLVLLQHSEVQADESRASMTNIVNEICLLLQVGRESQSRFELERDLFAAIDEHKRKITRFVEEKIIQSLERVPADERPNGLAVCLVGGGSVGLEQPLRRTITEAMQRTMPGGDREVVWLATGPHARDAVVQGAMKRLRDEVTEPDRAPKYRSSYGIRRLQAARTYELKPEILIHKGSDYFPDEEHIHLMHIWDKNNRPLPRLPNTIKIFQYSDEHLEVIHDIIKQKEGRQTTATKRKADQTGLCIGEIVLSQRILESYMYVANQPDPSNQSDCVGGGAAEMAKGRMLEYQLVISISSRSIEVQLRTAQMDASQVPKGKPRVIELGRMRKEMKTGEA